MLPLLSPGKGGPMVFLFVGIFIGASLGFFLAAMLALNKRNQEAALGCYVRQDTSPPESLELSYKKPEVRKS